MLELQVEPWTKGYLFGLRLFTQKVYYNVLTYKSAFKLIVPEKKSHYTNMGLAFSFGISLVEIKQ